VLPIAAFVLLVLVAAIVALTRGGDDNGGGGDGGGDDASAYAAAILADDPILYWRLDDDGDTAADASGNGGDGTYEDGLITGEESFLPDGSAVDFGESSYVRGPDLKLAGGPFTVELWAKSEAPEDGRQHNIFSQGTDAGNAGFHLAFTPDRRFKCDFYNNPYRTVEVYPDGGWHLWVCSYDPATDRRRLYRDGRPVAAQIVPGGASGEYTGGGDVFLGVPPWNGPGFIGGIDEVAVYPTVLSREQVLEHYEARR
jgi:trimeric autotransporter adhesin